MLSFTPVSTVPVMTASCDGPHGPEYVTDPCGDAYCAHCGQDMMGDHDDEEYVRTWPTACVAAIFTVGFGALALAVYQLLASGLPT